MVEFTQLLNSAASGDPQAAAELLPLVYEELRRVARAKMAQESSDHTLQGTALVHEAWIRLSGSNQQRWENRNHFFAASAEAMRRILVDHARRKNAQKRGSGVAPEALQESDILLQAPSDEILAVHEALDELARQDPTSAELVKLRYFLGMSMDECASVLGISVRSTERLWAFARSWLKRALRSPNFS